MIGCSANLPDGQIYPLAKVSGGGIPLIDSRRYVSRSSSRQEPPAGTFWSLTLCDARGFQVANPINRFAIGDSDSLIRGAHGTLEILIQNAEPGPDRKVNWLPAPTGKFSITAQLYGPLAPAHNGSWMPPRIQRV